MDSVFIWFFLFVCGYVTNLYSANLDVSGVPLLCSSSSNKPKFSLHCRPNLSISDHQTNSKCQWWISLGDSWQSGTRLMCRTPLIFICCDLGREVCRWSVPLCEGSRESCERRGPDETPSGRTPHPANSHPSGSGRFPLISSHQWVPAHQHTLRGLPAPPAPPAPPLITVKRRWKGSSSIIQPPTDPWSATS